MHLMLALVCQFLMTFELLKHCSIDAWGSFSRAAVVRCAPSVAQVMTSQVMGSIQLVRSPAMALTSIIAIGRSIRQCLGIPAGQNGSPVLGHAGESGCR